MLTATARFSISLYAEAVFHIYVKKKMLLLVQPNFEGHFKEVFNSSQNKEALLRSGVLTKHCCDSSKYVHSTISM